MTRNFNVPKRILTLTAILLMVICTMSMPTLATTQDQMATSAPMRMTQNEQGVKHIACDDTLQEYTSMDVYSNEDGTKTAYFYNEPIRYEKIVDGHITYADIDNSIVYINNKSSKYAYKNAANAFDVLMPSRLDSKTGVCISQDHFAIEIMPESAKACKGTVSKHDSTVIEYSGVFGDGTSVQYTMTPLGYKEDIILQKDIGVYEFKFLIKAENVVFKQKETLIEIYEADSDEHLGKINPVFVYDSGAGTEVGERYSFDSKQEISSIGDGVWQYTLYVDKAFMQDALTQYPVYVDPTLVLNGDNTISDGFILQSLPNSTV